MKTQKIAQLETRIQSIQEQLQTIGAMRPGSLSRQFRKPKEKKGAFWQLNCTHKMRTTTEYVRPECLPQIRAELKEYQRFRKLVEKWIENSLLISRLKTKKA